MGIGTIVTNTTWYQNIRYAEWQTSKFKTHEKKEEEEEEYNNNNDNRNLIMTINLRLSLLKTSNLAQQSFPSAKPA